MNTANKIIEIIITSDGKTTVETKGFVGASCRDASKFIEDALGQSVSEQLTGEFHQTQSNEQQVRQQH